MRVELKKIALKDLSHGTNVLDLEVPSELEKTVPTTVSFFDEAMGGEGLTPSMAVLFSGTPGAGKTTLMLQCADAITGSGNVCLFNTSEESPVQVRKVTKRLKIKNGFYIGQDVKTRDIIRHARMLKKKNPGKQLFVVVDSVQSSDDGKYPNGHTNSMTGVRVCQELADFAKETLAIVILICQTVKGGETFKGKNEMKHVLDAHVHLMIDKKKKSPTFGYRLLSVTKNRFASTGEEIICDMTPSGLKKIDQSASDFDQTSEE